MLPNLERSRLALGGVSRTNSSSSTGYASSSAPVSPLCKWLLRVLILGTLLFFLVRLAAPRLQQRAREQYKQSWEERLHCIRNADTSCDVCSEVPVAPLLLAPPRRVVAVALEDRAIFSLKEKTEAATRLCTTSYQNFGDPSQISLCAFTAFSLWMDAVPLNPARAIFVLEHPFRARSTPEAELWTRRVHEMLLARKEGVHTLLVAEEELDANPEASALQVLDFVRPEFLNGTLPPTPSARSCVSRSVVASHTFWEASPAPAPPIYAASPEVCAAIKPAFALPHVRAKWEDVVKQCQFP